MMAIRLGEAAGIHARAAQAHLTFAQHLPQHDLDVVVALGHLLPALGARDRVGHQEQAVGRRPYQQAVEALAAQSEWLSKFDEIVLMFDSDEPGTEAAKAAAEAEAPGAPVAPFLVVGGTDSHNGAPSNVEEDNWAVGSHGLADQTAEIRSKATLEGEMKVADLNPGAITGVAGAKTFVLGGTNTADNTITSAIPASPAPARITTSAPSRSAQASHSRTSAAWAATTRPQRFRTQPGFGRVFCCARSGG